MGDKASLWERASARVRDLPPLKHHIRGSGETFCAKPGFWRRDRGAFSIGFDDFPRSAWLNGGPVLAARGVPGVYYVSGGFALGERPHEDPFTLDDLGEIAAAGHELGCHTYSHVSATTATADRWRRSLDANARFFAERLPSVNVSSFAYAYGDVSIETKQVCAARFATARGTRWGVNAGLVDAAELLAVGLEREGDRPDLRALAAEARAKAGWLFLYTHEVSPTPGPHGCTPDELAAAIDIALAAGLEPVTPAQAAACLGPAS